MQYDIFISYSRKDNANGRVAELKKQIEADYRAFANEELKCFFDLEEITGMEDWKHRLLQGLRDSHLLLLILSPNYLASPYCEWEIVEYLKYEYSRAVQGDGVAQIYFMEIPGIDEPGFKEKAATWLERVSCRQRIDLRPWHDEGTDSLKRVDVKTRLEELRLSLHNRITRMRRGANAFGNLPAPNPRFVGREREMKSLHESVGLGRLGVITAVHGIGGLGKTALAFQYAYAYADFYPGGRWYIGCANETDLAAVLKKLDLDLKVEFSESERKDDIRGAKRILNELETLAKKGAEARVTEKNPPKPAVLLLFDNIDRPELLHPFNMDLISGKDWLKILATTRMGPEELGADEAKQSLLTIDELPFEDALSLIENYQPGKRFRGEKEKEKAGEIVRLLGGFTLAVEVAALYLYEREGQVTCAAFLEMLKKEGGIEGIETAGSKTKTALSHTKLISATLIPTLNTLSPEETLILSLASLLPADTIPIPWLRAMVVSTYPNLNKKNDAGLDDPWLTSINHLLSLRLIQTTDFDADGFTPRIARMHRVIGAMLQQRQGNELQMLRNQVTDYVTGRCGGLEYTWYESQWEIMPVIAYARILLESRDPKVLKYVRSLGQWLTEYDEGRYSVAIMEDALKQAEEDPTSGPFFGTSDLAVILSNLGLALNNMGRHEEAEHHYIRAIEIDRNSSSQEGLVVRYCNLGSCQHDLDKLEDARSSLQSALRYADDFGYTLLDRITLACIMNLASVESDMGNTIVARELLLLAKEKRERDFPENDPFLADCYAQLGIQEMKMCNYVEARKLLSQALDIDKILFSVDHLTIASLSYYLAKVEERLGNFSDAKALLRNALEIQKKFYGMGHPKLKATCSLMSIIDQEMKDKFNQVSDSTRPIPDQQITIEHQKTPLNLEETAFHLVKYAQGQLLFFHWPGEDLIYEAELLYRRAIELLLKHASVTGEIYPEFQSIFDNYREVIHAMNWDDKKGLSILNEIGERYNAKFAAE